MGTAEWQRSHSQLPLCMSRWVTRTDRNVQLWCDSAEAKTCLGSQDVCHVPKQSPALTWSVIRFASPPLDRSSDDDNDYDGRTNTDQRWCWLEAKLQCWRREWQWKVICADAGQRRMLMACHDGRGFESNWMKMNSNTDNLSPLRQWQSETTCWYRIGVAPVIWMKMFTLDSLIDSD